MNYYVLFNPASNNGHGKVEAADVERYLNGHFTYIQIQENQPYDALFSRIEPGSSIVLTGGDGTLNYFINHTTTTDYERWQFLYFPTGTGNDFYKDALFHGDKKPVALSRYLSNLPTVTVKNKTYRFINGIGYGLDGFCCEEADRIKAKSNRKINYTAIALKGLLFSYKTTDAEVTVDGITTRYSKVWMAPTMKGRYYGGGVIPTPAQDRFDKNRHVSCLVMHNLGKLKALLLFNNVVKGKHIGNKKHCAILTGSNITVRFNTPRALQIDGETVTGVDSYTVQV